MDAQQEHRAGRYIHASASWINATSLCTVRPMRLFSPYLGQTLSHHHHCHRHHHHFSFLGCHNRHQQLGGLKQQKFTFSVLEGRSLKSKCRQSHALSDGSTETPSAPLPSSWWPPAIPGLPRLVGSITPATQPPLPVSSPGLPSVQVYLCPSFPIL